MEYNTHKHHSCKMIKIFITPLLSIVILAAACDNSQNPNQTQQIHETLVVKDENKIAPSQNISERFPTPDNYLCAKHTESSYYNFLKYLPLEPENTKVHLYNGNLKSNQAAHAAVIKMDIGTEDLQQCADAVIRLRAEYLFNSKQYDKISFTFTNGFKADYGIWRSGKSIRISNNKCDWILNNEADASYKSFRKYLRTVFMYAGTLSLSRQLNPISDLNKIEIGDVFIKGGTPGHAVVVVNVATHKTTGKKIFMLAQSYMPAQQIQVLKNVEDPDLSPWYEVEAIKGYLYTPEYTFDRSSLMRF